MSSAKETFPSLYFVTRNQNKVREIEKLLGDSFEIRSLDDLGVEEDIPETGRTIEENSRLKVDYIVDRYGVNCFADDSGLEVEALNGDPGVYSARYAGEDATDDENIKLLLENLLNSKNRRARFKTVITLYLKGEYTQFTGTVEGKITDQPQGDGGFGYDPIFQPISSGLTFAQITMDEKNRISHRGKAVRELVSYLQNFS